jgi:F-type H+-transporting ATPase subunit a
VPGRFQAAVEMLVEMVDNQAKANIHNAQAQVHRSSGTDRVRLDLPDERHGHAARGLLPVLWQTAQGDSTPTCVVPTADLSTTLGLSRRAGAVPVYTSRSRAWAALTNW